MSQSGKPAKRLGRKHGAVFWITPAVVELERGHSGSPFTWLAAVGGITYIASVVAQRVRQ